MSAVPAPLDLPSLGTLPRPRVLRRIAFVLASAFILFGIGSLMVPWTQNVSGTGRVTAFDPLDRIQTIPAPVTGRLVKLNVQDGSYVKRGDILAVMEDQDPDFSARLAQQFEFTREEVAAAKDVVAFYDQQLVHLEDAREQAISSATFDLNVAIEKVRSEENEMEAVEADLEQKRLDLERKTSLWREGYMSELDYQKADRDYKSASAKLESARAKVEQARNDEKGKMAKVSEVSAAQRAKIESTKSLREDARTKVALAERKLTEAETRVRRQETQVVAAPRDGYILRARGRRRAGAQLRQELGLARLGGFQVRLLDVAEATDLLGQGAPLIDLIPDTEELAVELWVRGVDAPLITPGRPVRLQFEGWPAVQFVGWPSVAVGTFGGIVQVVDAHAREDGRLRVLVVPDKDDAPWPDRRYLRQGGRANGWVLLENVTLGFELWRQLNAFPPSVNEVPDWTPAKSGVDSKSGKSKDEKNL